MFATDSDKTLKTDRKVLLAILFAVIAFASGSLLELLLKPFPGLDPRIPVRGLRAVISVAAYVKLSEKKWMGVDMKAVGRTFLYCIPLYFYAAILGIMGAVTNLKEGVPDGLGLRITFFAVLFIIVGINEEFIFRGLMFGGMMKWLSKKKHGVVKAAVLSSFLFGFIHVCFVLDYSNPYSLLTGLFKTVNTGMFGFVLCYCFFRNKNIWCVVALHAFNDFLIQMPGMVKSMEMDPQYVQTTKDAAMSSIDLYTVFIVLYLPSTVIGFIKLSKAGSCEGPLGEDTDTPEET